MEINERQVVICVECGKPFTISDNERQWFIDKNLALPKRCFPCRQKRKQEREATKNDR